MSLPIPNLTSASGAESSGMFEGTTFGPVNFKGANNTAAPLLLAGGVALFLILRR